MASSIICNLPSKAFCEPELKSIYILKFHIVRTLATSHSHFISKTEFIIIWYSKIQNSVNINELQNHWTAPIVICSMENRTNFDKLDSLIF